MCLSSDAVFERFFNKNTRLPPFHDAFSQGIEPQKLQKSKKKAVIFFTPVFSSNFIEIKHVKSDDEGIDAVIIIIIIIINLLFDIVVAIVSF